MPSILLNNADYNWNVATILGAGNYPCMSGPSAVGQTEPIARQRFGAGGVVSNLRVRVSINARGADCQVRSRLNGSNGNALITIPAMTTGSFEDSSNSDNISTGDDWYYSIFNTGAGSSQLQVTNVRALWTPTSGEGRPYAASPGSGPNASGASTTYYQPLCGAFPINFLTSQTGHDFECRAGGTFSYLTCSVLANTRGTDSTLVFRLASSDGNQSVTIPASTTGRFTDASNSDTVTNADRVIYKIVNGSGSGNLTFNNIGCYFTSGGVAVDQWSSVGANRNGQSSGDCYFNTFGTFDVFSTSVAESVRQNSMPFDGRASRFRAYVSLQLTNGSVWTFRKNGSAGNQTFTVPTSGSGLFEDTGSFDDFVTGDLLSIHSTSAGATNTYFHLGITYSPPPVPPSANVGQSLIIINQ